MTKDEKQSATAEAKAVAFDHINDLLLTIDSYRNFHRHVEREVRMALELIRNIKNAQSTTLSFPCKCSDPSCKMHPTKGRCLLPATCQVYRYNIDDEFSLPMCEQCADDAIATGAFHLVEDTNNEEGAKV